jgi:hypothetical protein
MTNARPCHLDVHTRPAVQYLYLGSDRFPSWPADSPLWGTTTMRRSVRSI